MTVIGAIGVAAFATTAETVTVRADRPITTAATVPTHHHVDVRPAQAKPAARPGSHRIAEASVAKKTPVHRPEAERRTDQGPRSHRTTKPQPKPWLPSGTGMWIYQWHKTNGGQAASVVAQARRVGLTTLYLRTGSSWDGLSGRHALRELLGATRGTSLHVVAWDFPRLRHPVRDARRLARAARVGRDGIGPRVSAVAPDIETPAEGTFNAAWRVRTYMTALRRHLPSGVTILGTVPWPSRYRIADYPYTAVARSSDALVPMAYWYNNPPALVTARSISYLRRFNKPVQPVGQGYDGKLDVPSLRHNHLAREVPRFLRTAHQHGAQAVSVWSWQSAPRATWRALDRAQRMFATR